jgi:hypothetical protein
MPNCTREFIEMGRLGRKKIRANFFGGDTSSDGGLLLLREVDKRVGLSSAIAEAIHDPRESGKVRHSIQEMLSQRLYALCQGHSDLNDHLFLRHDPLMQTAVGKEEALASSSTLCRFENTIHREDLVRMNKVLVEQFIKSQSVVPQGLVLDIDGSDIPLHGDQEGGEYHGYYRSTCYLPLYVYCGDELLCFLLRRGRADGAKHAAAVIRLLVTRLRRQWSGVHITVRGDAAFCRQRLLNWCERNAVRYVIGVRGNARLSAMIKDHESQLKADWEKERESQRRLVELRYGARSWKKERRVIARLTYSHGKPNHRFIVTNLAFGTDMYDYFYVKRGESENRIKETQLDLFGTRASCQLFYSNWFRGLLSAFAYTLMKRLREMLLIGTKFAMAGTNTIRMQLLRIGAVVVSNTRRINVMLSSHHPNRSLFANALQKLAPP